MLIGEVSAVSGISARMLRHYDAVGLVSPTGRTSGGYRSYSPADVRRLFHVEGLRSLGLSLAEVAEALAERSFDPATVVERLVAGTRARIAREEELLGRLGRVRASDPGDWSDVLRTIGLMRSLDGGGPSARQRLALSHAGGDDRDAVVFADAMLAERDPNVAGALGWALARTGDRAVPALAEAIGSADAERRLRALDALVKIGSPLAQDVLAAAARHPDPRVRARSALVRGARGGTDAVGDLVAMVVEGRDDVAAADVLGLLASRRGPTDDPTGATSDRADGATADGADGATADDPADVAAEIAGRIAHELTGAGDAARRRLTAALVDVPGPRATTLLAGLAADPDPGVAGPAAREWLSRSEPR